MAVPKRTKLDSTGERMIPEHHKGGLIYAEHYTRYLSSCDLVDGKEVLDIACGSGYGTKMLAARAKKVYGVDVDAPTVQYAKENFAASNITYSVGDGAAIPLKDNSIDVVVTFETIEHIADYERFLDEVQRVLRPDGVILVSTPNDVEYAEGNDFHAHEFKKEELVKTLKKRFRYAEEYYQATWKYVAIGREKYFKAEGPSDFPTLNLAPLNQDQYLYFYIVCSNSKINHEIRPLGALGEHYSYRAETEKIATYQQVIDAHVAQIGDLKHELAKSRQKLTDMTTSRSFQLARRVADLGNRFRR